MESETKKDIEKRQFRKEILAYREAMEEHVWQEKSGRIQQQLLSHPLFQEAEQILCYVNYKREVETLPILKQSLALKKRVYCPRVSGNSMDFFEIFSIEELSSGFHGILEPKKQKERRFDGSCKGRTLMLMPGVVFDRMHHRIGYGKGYYDRYLSCTKDSYSTVALAFAFQIKERIPFEAHDICPDLIITEQEIL